MPPDTPLLAYIDPTGGLPPSLWSAAIASLLAALGVLITALKVFGWRVVRFWTPALVRPAAVVVAGLAVLIMGAMWFKSSRRPPEQPPPGADQPRVLVLAFDGLDPQLLDRYLSESRLPNFARLAKTGIYHPLATVTSPQSPVAWCSFITGEDPGGHGVFDFIKRDPVGYQLDLALADRRKLTLPWQGKPFWQQPAIDELGLIAQRLPMIFPPPKLNGRVLAGMGVWDLRGTEGTYFFYSTEPQERPGARGMLLKLTRDSKLLRGELPGPYRAGQSDKIREPFSLELASDKATLRLQQRTYVLANSRWSDWIDVEFRLGALGLEKIRAITRVLPKIEGEHVTLYVSPLNFDPRAPLYPISYPRSYSAELAESVGLYATRGMPFDTQAVSDGVLSDADFLEQVDEITSESERMLLGELPNFRSGVLFAYFEASDIVQHMFWRGIDDKHPLHNDRETQQHAAAIPQMYERCDEILGRAQAAMGTRGAVVVLSDHGFAPFRTAVHLNSVLRQLGWLALKDKETASGEFFKQVDWSRTKAYALGFNAVYLNVKGREGQGIVAPEKADLFARELQTELDAWVDPATREHPIRHAHICRDEFSKKQTDNMPDLIVGYARNYRASWETALGAVPEKLSEPNRKKWSGDHCIDAHEVPGIFLSSNRSLDAQSLPEVGAALEKYLAAQRKAAPP